MVSPSNPRARAARAMQIAAERGWLDPSRVEAVLRLNAAWGKDAIDCALEASWITDEHAHELRARLGAAPPPQALPTVGQQVGPYELERALGAGSTGTVFVGRHRQTQARHALKLVAFGTTPSSSTTVQRFLREGQALARLSHPGVVKVHSCEHFADSNLGLLALELVDGSSLEDWLTHQPLWYEAVVDLGLQLAEALVHIHAAGIVHRDLKPENLLVRAEDARLVVCDFGVARDEQADSLTHTGQLLGSPAYMAPEQISGDRHAIGPATDVYAWAVTLYRLVANTLPFDAPSLVELASQIVVARPTPLRQHRPDVPPDLERLIAAGLSKSPSERPSAAALVESLNDLDRRPARRTARFVLPAVAALALVAGAGWLTMSAAAPVAPAPQTDPTPAPSSPTTLSPAEAWARVEALSPRARYPAIGAWLAEHPDHALAPRAVAARRSLLQTPLRKLRFVGGFQLQFLDDHRLLIGGSDKALVWDLVGDREEQVRAPGPFRRLALSADRSRFAIACEGPTGQVAVHAASTLELLQTIPVPANAVALDRDGTRVAIAQANRITVHAVETGERRFMLPSFARSPVRGLRFLANGDLLVARGSASEKNTLTRWSPAAKQRWTTDVGERPSALLALPNGQLLLGTSAANLALYAGSNGSLTGRLSGGFTGFRTRQAHAGNVSSACLVPGRPWVLTGSSGGRARHRSYPPNDLRLWDPDTRKLLHTWRPHPRDQYRAVASPPRGDVIAVACPLAGTVEVWLTDALVESD